MATGPQAYYELYRRSSDERIDPQLAMKILTTFDEAMTLNLQSRVKARLTFKGSLDTYRFCDEVWTFLIKNLTFKLEGGTQVQADKVKIVSCNAKKPEQ